MEGEGWYKKVSRHKQNTQSKQNDPVPQTAFFCDNFFMEDGCKKLTSVTTSEFKRRNLYAPRSKVLFQKLNCTANWNKIIYILKNGH